MPYICTRIEPGGEAYWYNHYSKPRRYRGCHSISRVTKALVILANGVRDRRDGFAVGTTAEIEEARRQIATDAAERERREKEQAALEADPRYQLARWMNSDTRPFDKLTPEQLQTIDRWLTEAEKQ